MQGYLLNNNKVRLNAFLISIYKTSMEDDITEHDRTLI